MKKIYTFLILMLSIVSIQMVASNNLDDKNYDSGDLFLVTFQVDMNEYTGTYTTVNLNGFFNSWCGTCAEMLDGDGDGIYTLEVELSPGPTEYKFTVDGWTDEENLIPGSECTITVGEFTNRTLNVTANETLPVVCWESCLDCENNVNNYDVTFQLDLSEYTGTYAMVNVNGVFNGWCGACTPMTDGDGDDIYEVTVTLPEGNMEYKFTLDGWTVEENLTEGSSCTLTTEGFTNRIINVTQDETLEAVCWEGCATCGNEVPTYDVTFKVDMNEYSGTYTIVNLNGIFNGWCGDCAVMTDDDEDNVYEITVPILEGITEYKFTLDGWDVEESLDEEESCTLTTDGFTNRFLDVTEEVVLTAVCWESCSACGPDNISELEALSNVTLYPNPSDGMVNLKGMDDWNEDLQIEIYSTTGQLVMSKTLNSNQSQIQVGHLTNGVYQIKLSDGDKFIQRSLSIFK